MSLEITLVRHAESQANLDTHLIGGYQPSISLSPIGIFQAEALGKKWHTEGVEFDAVWSSDAVRTKQTAQYAIYRILQTKWLITDPALRELGQGKWEGKLRAEIYTPEVKIQLDASNGYFIPPGGESQDMVRIRMRWWLDGIMEKYKDSGAMKICVFSHGLAINLLREVVDNEPRNTAWKRVLQNTGVSKLENSSGEWKFTSWNDVSHLPAHLLPHR